MLAFKRWIAAAAALMIMTAVLAACGSGISHANRGNIPLSKAAISKLAAMGSSPAEPMMIRIYKESSELEVWKRTKSGTYKLFSTYEICAWSGELGPKFREGDRQSPEGFYTITANLLNPKSNYYLAFNTGFPNKFDRAWGRTGSDLMVHGDCSSRGCYAMTDEQIKEIYALARETLAAGNPSFQLEIYPFRMTPANLARHAGNPNMSFWMNLKEGYDRFALSGRPATWDVCNREYVFDVPQGMVLEAAAACPPGAIVRSAALEAKQKADAAEVARRVAELEAKAVREAEVAEKAAREKAAIAARGAAVGGFVSGIFGDGAAPATTTDPAVTAPTPLPRIKRG